MISCDFMRSNPPPSRSIIYTGLGLIIYRPFSPHYSFPNITLRPVLPSQQSSYADPSLYFPKAPARKPTDIARCFEPEKMAADTIGVFRHIEWSRKGTKNVEIIPHSSVLAITSKYSVPTRQTNTTLLIDRHLSCA